MFTDVELGMAHACGQRLRAEQAEAQTIINRIHGQLVEERAAHRKTAAALTEANAMIAKLQRHLAEVDAALAGQ